MVGAWKPGDLVYVDYSSNPFYGRVIGIRREKNTYTKSTFFMLRVQKLFDDRGNKIRTYRSEYGESFCTKVDQKYLDSIASRFTTMLNGLKLINQKDDPNKQAQEWADKWNNK